MWAEREASMTSIERLLLFFCALFAPLPILRLGDVNLTYFDLAVGALFSFQVIRFRSLPRLGMFYWAGATLIVAGASTAFFALEPEEVLLQVAQWAYIIFVVVPTICRAGRDPGNTYMMVLGAALAGALLAVHGLWEYSTGRGAYVGGRYTGLLGDPQILAFMVSSVIAYVLVLPAVFGRSGVVSRLVVTVFAAGLTALLAWLLLLSASRTGMIATALAMLTLLLLVHRGSDRSSRSGFLMRFTSIGLRVAALAGVLYLVIAFAAEQTLEVVQSRVESSFDASSSTMTGRTQVYDEVYQLMDVPMVIHGVGLENYPMHSRYDTRPHNFVILFLAEGGIIFMAAFVAMLTIPIRELVMARRRWRLIKYQQRYVVAAAAAGFIAFIVIAMFNTQSIGRMYWVNYAWILGVLSTIRRGNRK